MKLTKPQKLIYDMEKYTGGAISVICGSMLINGKEDINKLKEAVNEIYKLNDALRIHIMESKNGAEQVVSEYVKRDVEVLYFENKDELDSYSEVYAKEPIDLYGNLCEIKIVILSEKFGILVKLHHMVGDAWTLSLLGTQFNKILNGEKVEGYSYVDYIKKEGDYLQSTRYEKDKEFFIEQFKKCDEVTYINEKQSRSNLGNRKTFIIDNVGAKQIREYASEKGISPFVLFTTVLVIYMNRIKMNAEKFYIGTAVLNRRGPKEKNTMGMFVNTVPMLAEINNEKSFAENLKNIKAMVFSILRHQKHHYGDVLSEIRKKYSFTEKLYDVMISYQNATVTGAKCETTWYYCGEQTESLEVHIDDRDNEGIFRIHYDYLVDKFTEHDINMLHQHIENLLFDAIENDSKLIYELDILTTDEKQKLFFDFNDTVTDYLGNECIYELFEKQVQERPDTVALCFKDKLYTYSELKNLINSYSNALDYYNIRKGDVVAVHIERSYKLIALQLATLKIGAIFLPVDKRYPLNRIQYMCKDCNVKILITDTVLDINDTNIVSLNECEITKTNRSIPTVINNGICYIIYTSGSTGNPKGCMLTDKGIRNFCKNNNTLETLKSREGNIFACVNSVSFDYFIAESLLPLLNGYTVVVLDDEESSNQELFLKIVNKYGINVLMTTPTRLKMFYDDRNECKELEQLDCICTAGEALPPELLEKMYEKSPIAQIYNPLGPSECTVWNVGGGLEREKGIDIHIGKPIANTQIYIVDKYMRPMPIGVTGELCISGAGVGVGYLNRPELTAKKFIDNPFGRGKLYKTGDLVYWREDGNIAYVGRNDFQVKIRGLRIELGEIENAICGIDGISQSVVVVRKNNEGRQLICAFYTGREFEAKDIRNYIGKKLPKYMIPHIFTYIEKMPMTSNGKINRKGLPKIDLKSVINNTEFIKPETVQQMELCKLVESVLETTNVGITDDFFDLGGDSLKAIELVSKAHNEGIYFNLQNIFDYPTVKELCECIKKGDQQEISFEEVDFTEINRILEVNKIENISVSKETKVGNLLLAGATGYLGIHILADYLDNDNGIAYCLVRGKNKEDSKNRLSDLLRFYFDDKYSDMNRIKVIKADLQKDDLGLAQIEYDELLHSVDTIINAAASVKHYGTYKYFYEINVEATKRLIDFCKRGNKKLIHISTLSVSGNGFDNGLIKEEKYFSESDLYIGQPLENVYARSKFEAEKAVFEAILEGVEAKVLRMGNLTNRLSDGKFQQNYKSNAFLNRIRALMKLKSYPESVADYEVEFTPIDKAANAVMTIVRNFDDNLTVFHINNPLTITVGKLFSYFEKMGYRIKQLSDDEFKMQLIRSSKDESMEHIFETFINDMDENTQLNYDSNIRIENEFTVSYLKNLGFEWSDMDVDYLQKYVAYFREIGYLE